MSLVKNSIRNSIKNSNQIYNTSFGRFNISINTMKSLDLMTREEIIISYTINIGGNTNKCVQIKVDNNIVINTAELLIVKTSLGDCELNGIKIKKENTIKMVLLAFTILQEKFPHITQVKLQDKSSFECTFENGTHSGISLIIYEILFHQHTWYHRHFNAKLINEDLHNTYINAITYNLTKKSLKPDMFDFNNAILNEKLLPIYKQSETWKDFLDKIYKLPKLCEIIFPWYKYTSALLLDNINLDKQWWIIDLKHNNKIYPISYTISTRGGNATRKNKIVNEYEETSNEPTYDELYNYKYLGINFNALYK